jgi:hypothetical protein
MQQEHVHATSNCVNEMETRNDEHKHSISSESGGSVQKCAFQDLAYHKLSGLLHLRNTITHLYTIH